MASSITSSNIGFNLTLFVFVFYLFISNDVISVLNVSTLTTYPDFTFLSILVSSALYTVNVPEFSQRQSLVAWPNIILR